MELPTLETLPVIDVGNVAEAKTFYEKYGLVLVRLLQQPACDELVLEQWKKIIRPLPWTEEHQIRVRSSTEDPLYGALVDPVGDREEFLKAVKGPLKPEVRREFEQGWCLHRGFGACCDPAVFHLAGVWKLREDPRLYSLASALAGVKELWVDINRSIQMLPGQGEQEFLHWDLNPFAPRNDDADTPTNICGKVCYTQSIFVAVCGTHTKEFFSKFTELYQPLYPDVKPNAAKFGLAFDKPDPLGLVERQREFVVPPGCMVLWSDNLLHGQVKSPLDDPVRYGCYIGYFPAGSRPKYEQVIPLSPLSKSSQATPKNP
jgi:hypothetical protein